MRPTAVVIGASATGLLAAAALADFADVTVVERDRLPDGPEPRRGVPQARHAHLVWSGGVKALDDLLPGLTREIVAHGGRLAHIMGDMVSRAPNEVWFRRFTSTHHRNLVCSRDLLDSVLRGRVLADERITLRQETTALRLEGDATAVTGVRIRAGAATDAYAGDDADAGERTLRADLVVDASGRGSRAPRWLTELGGPSITEREVNAGCRLRHPSLPRPRGGPEHRLPPRERAGQPGQGARAGRHRPAHRGEPLDRHTGSTPAAVNPPTIPVPSSTSRSTSTIPSSANSSRASSHSGRSSPPGPRPTAVATTSGSNTGRTASSSSATPSPTTTPSTATV